MQTAQANALQPSSSPPAARSAQARAPQQSSAPPAARPAQVRAPRLASAVAAPSIKQPSATHPIAKPAPMAARPGSDPGGLARGYKVVRSAGAGASKGAGAGKDACGKVAPAMGCARTADADYHSEAEAFAAQNHDRAMMSNLNRDSPDGSVRRLLGVPDLAPTSTAYASRSSPITRRGRRVKANEPLLAVQISEFPRQTAS